MTVSNKSPLQTLKLRNHHLALSIWPEGGRVLEVQSLKTGSHLVSWWPFKLDSAERMGGLGERTFPAGAPCWKVSRSERSVKLTRSLPGGLSLEKTITLPPDSPVFTVSILLANTSDDFRRYVLEESAAVCPGFGGPCPEPASGISHCREKAVLKRPDRPPETIPYEVFERVSIERDDLEWAAFNDPVSANLFCLVLPEGHVRIRTEYHWWLDWSNQLALEPGGRYTADFRYIAAGSLDLPLLASEHFLAGFKGALAPFGKEGAGEVLVCGLSDTAQGNKVTVKADGKELVGGKPLPAGGEPVTIALPQWRPRDGLSLEVAVGGKFGQARLAPCRCSDLYEQLEGLCKQAAKAAAEGAVSQTKAAAVLAHKRIVDLNRDKCTSHLEVLLEEAFNGASAVLECPLESVPFYTEAEGKTLARLASRLDMSEAAARAKEALGRPYDLSRPRFREGDPAKGASALAAAMAEAALVLNVHRDEELLRLFKERLREVVSLWAVYGQIRYETIHHGVFLCHLIPACKIVSGTGGLSLEEEAEAMAMILDLCAKVRRQGGRQFRLSNWWAMEKAALAYAGSLFPYLPAAAEYRREALEAFYWLLVHGTLADGGFWEMSPSYHVLTLTYLHHIAEALLRSGRDLYRGETCGRRVADMADFVKRIAVPAGALPAFDDSHRRMPGGAFLSIAKRLYDGELLFHALKAFEREGREAGVWNLFVPVDPPEPRRARRGSEVLIPSGKVILRSPRSNLTFIFDFGPHGGWHGHSDKLSFEAFWRDVCLVPDAGSYKYEDSLHWEWFKTARAHNTVTVGESDRAAAAGRLLYFEEGRGFVTAGMAAPLDRKASHRREVTFSDRALLIDDFVENAPAGEILVWRMNSYSPITLAGGVASFEREGVTVTVTPVSEGLEMEVAQVPLMGEKPSAKQDFVTGWQLRIRRQVKGDSQRILVRLDLGW